MPSRGQGSDAVAAGGDGDVADAGDAEDADRGVAQRGHDLRSSAGTDLGSVIIVGDISHLVDLAFDVPVAADTRGELRGLGLVYAQVGDRIDGLAQAGDQGPPISGHRSTGHPQHPAVPVGPGHVLARPGQGS